AAGAPSALRSGDRQGMRWLWRASFRRRRKPAVEVVEDRFDGWAQLAGDLVLVLALAGAAPGLGDDDLEDAGERDAPQLCDLGRARHVADRDLLIPALGEQPRGRVGDELARAGLLAFAQAEVGHGPSIANFDLTQKLVQTKS